MSIDQQAVEAFRDRFGKSPDVVVAAPGRVNLIGEHTDYHDGYVLPMAINRRTVIAAGRRSDRRINAVSEGFGEAGFDLDDLRPDGDGWVEYLKGVAWALDPETLTGWDGAITSEIPLAAALSSSAALEIGTALTFTVLSDREWDPVQAALSCRRAENEWLGLSSGIMDQLVCAAGHAGHTLLIDCRHLHMSSVPIPPGVDVVVLNTGTQRKLTESRYNERRQEGESAAKAYGVPALRDLTHDQLHDAPIEDPLLFRRARHIISENQRTLAAAEALTAGDVAEVGRLMIASHESLRHDYEVSGLELDAMVEAALAAPGCLGARMTGGGFAGCAVALIESEALETFTAETSQGYKQATGREPHLYRCKASDGAKTLT